MDKINENAAKKKGRSFDARTVIAVTVVLLLVFGLGVQYQAYLSGVKPAVAEAADIVAVADFAAECAENDIIILLSGEVAHKGYYAVSSDTTLRDIVEFAGVKAAGDIGDFDMTHKPTHGDEYYIRNKDNPLDVTPWLANSRQAEAADVNDEVQNTVNLNTATLDELLQLPNIGEVKAEAIIEYRLEHSGFKHKEDLLGVDGIGQKTYEQLMDKITV